MSWSGTHYLIWSFCQCITQCFDQLLNIKAGQDVGPYLFPLPVLFPPGNGLLGLLTDNEVAVGIVNIVGPCSLEFT